MDRATRTAGGTGRDDADRVAGLPRYQRLSALLAREIADGRHPVGSLLPPEPDLCRRFGVSRHTLREAVRRLCDQGLVARRQGVGTRVVASRVAPAGYVAALGSLKELMQYTQRTRMRRLSHRERVADAGLARELCCEPGERWLEIETCRHAIDARPDAPPLVHMRIYVRPPAAGLLAELERGRSWVFGLVEKHGGERIALARQVVGALAMPAASARVLQVRPRTPGLLVRRYYLARDERLLSVSVNVYPAARFELATEWRLTNEG